MKKTNYFHLLLLLAGMAGIAGLASCGKSDNNPASIVGTWTFYSFQRIETISGTVVIDTTTRAPYSETMTFTADRRFSISPPPLHSSGSYIEKGDSLTFVWDLQSPSSVKVQNLTAHNFVMMTSFQIQTNPPTIINYVSNYVR